MNFPFICENFLFCFLGTEAVFGLVSFGIYSFSELLSLVLSLTLLSVVIFLKVIYFEENVNNIVSFDSIISKHQIYNLFLRHLSSKFYINNN